MLSAYVLIQTEVGKVAHVAQALSDLDGVQMAEDLAGHCCIEPGDAGEAQRSGGPPHPKAAKDSNHPIVAGLPSLSGEVEAARRGDRSMQQCQLRSCQPPQRAARGR
jgi:hypothetical protein